MVDEDSEPDDYGEPGWWEALQHERFWTQVAIVFLLTWTARYGWLPADGFDGHRIATPYFRAAS